MGLFTLFDIMDICMHRVSHLNVLHDDNIPLWFIHERTSNTEQKRFCYCLSKL